MANDVFLVSPVDGSCVSFDDFFGDVFSAGHDGGLETPHNCYDAFRTIVSAVKTDAEITLKSGPLDHEEPLPAPAGPASHWSEIPRTATEIQALLADSKATLTLLTSGTTGKPKRVEHTIASLCRSVRIGDRHKSDVWGFAYHPAHFAGLQVFFQALSNRNPMVRLFGLDVEHASSAISRYGVTHLSATPTFLNLLVSGGVVHESVRQVTLGGEIAPPSVVRKLSTAFPNARITNIYAMSEAGALLSSQGDRFVVPEEHREHLKVVDGELRVHQSLLSRSTNFQLDDGFYRTGDTVEVLNENPLEIRFLARTGDMINVGGYKVNPHQVEAALSDLAEVLQVRVYGRVNSVTGGIVCCDLVSDGVTDINSRWISQRLRDRLPSYAIPRIVNVVDSIKTTQSGKTTRS